MPGSPVTPPNFIRSVLVAALVGAACGVPAYAAAYSNLVLFGDSVSDGGNVALALGVPLGVPQAVSNTYIPDAPYPTDGTYFPATFSNGPVWATRFAGMLGLGAAPSLAGGTDYAFAGARTGRDTDVPSLLTQSVGMYLASTGGVADPAALYVVAEVGNDVRDVLAGTVTPSQGIADYANNLGLIVDALQGGGAQHIMVLNNANLGLVPSVQAYGPDVATTVSTVAATLNFALGARLAGEPGVEVFDTFSFFNRVVGDMSGHGLDNVTDACGAIAGADCSKYLFWDGLHPTSAGHALLAREVYAAVVPEPASYALIAFGLVAVGCAAGRRRLQD